jgi:DNA-binding NtrC family response regulator
MPPSFSATPRSAEDAGAIGPLEMAVFFDDAVDVHPLPPSGRVSIGRSGENDISIPHASVSRRHAVLHLGTTLRLEDCSSANGTRVRDAAKAAKDETIVYRQLRSEASVVAPGDAITFGDVRAVIRRVQAKAADAPPGAVAGGRGVVVSDPAMRALYEQAQLAARSLISVLLLGETGAGKEVLASTIHGSSPRAGKPFLSINCAAVSESLLESELFGHEKGAFTGALQARPGLFEAADGGTIFLDEVGELPAPMQAKLLRVLEERQVLRVGSRTPRRVDVRFLAATNRDLEAEAARGAFRQDLFFRLNGIALTIPPLRERVSEIAALAHVFLANASAQLERPKPPRIPREVIDLLERYSWPGNVRELRNAIDRAVVLCTGDMLRPEHLPVRVRGEAAPPSRPSVSGHDPAPSARPVELSAPGSPAPVEADGPQSERERIVLALDACAGNQTQAAARLGISRRVLIARIESYNLPRPRKKA